MTERKCNPHPKAPHGFNRNASHSADRYVCECEDWDAYDAGYQAGFEDALKSSDANPGAQPDLNLACKSVQARLATAWGYVKKEHE